MIQTKQPNLPSHRGGEDKITQQCSYFGVRTDEILSVNIPDLVHNI